MKYSFTFSSVLFTSVALAQQSLYGQCGGKQYNGPTTCPSGSTCQVQNPWYSQCLPGSGSGSGPGPATTLQTSVVPNPTPAPSPPSNPQPNPPSNPPTSGGKTKYAGVNIAGFDFGCQTDGTCTVSGVYPPLTQFSGKDGPGQMAHFVKDDHMNAFRLPVAWQYLVNNKLGGALDATNFGKYDLLVQACLDTGALCILDIHNYARWNGAIIGQAGGPSNDHFASVWSQLAKHYAAQSHIAFGLMNEPHDIPDIGAWATSCHAAVTAIRDAGAKTQMVLLPGNGYTSAAEFVSSGSLAALKNVKNPDGSTANLVFDVHKYLDSDNSGTHAECVSNQIDAAFAPLATALRAAGRQAMVTETGGGNVDSCKRFLCETVDYLNSNSDVYLGYVGWSAGNFAENYVLSMTPSDNGGVWTDASIVSSCLKR